MLRVQSAVHLAKIFRHSRCTLFSENGLASHSLRTAAVAYSACVLPGSRPWLTPSEQLLQQLFPRGLQLSRQLTTASQEPKRPQPGNETPDSLELTDDKFSAITDKIPQRPVTYVEAGSYSLVILLALAAVALFMWQFIAEVVLTPPVVQCFNVALERLRSDPRITVRLGDDIRAYGAEGGRAARQHIPHQMYKDAKGVEHVRLQFHLRGPGGNALVSADMYKGEGGEWDYTYLVVDVLSHAAPTPQRLNIIAPHH